MTEVLAATSACYVLYRLRVGSLALLVLPGATAVSLAEWVKWRFYGRYRKKLLTEVIEHELAACLRCGYILLGLPDVHRCPECGEPYDLASTKLTWERWFASDTRGEVSQDLLESFRRHLEDARRMRARPTCIRCGHPLERGKTRLCPACGATHEVPPSDWPEHLTDV